MRATKSCGGKSPIHYVVVENWGRLIMTRKWSGVAGAAVLTLCFVSPARAQVDPAKCTAPVVTSDERIAACTAVIEAATGPKEGLAWAYNFRARAYFEVQDFDHAIADFSQRLELSPKEPQAHYNRGVAHLRKGNFDGAIADFSHAIQLDRRYGKAYLCRGDAYRAKGAFDDAIADYNEAIQLDPKI